MERTFFVLVPVYGTENYIDACVRSVLDQTYADFRLILVDDGTPDRAGHICDTYAAQDPRITVIHKENGGLISARRAGIARMLQEAQENAFAVFLDSDDALKPNALQILQDTIENHACDMVIYGMDRVFEGKVLEPFKPGKSFIGVIEEKRELYRTVFFSSTYNPLCRKAVSVKLLRDDDYSMYYHIRKGEDLLQSIPLYGSCQKAVFIKDSLYQYTFNPDSISNTYRFETYRIDSTVRRQVEAFLERENVWDARDWEAFGAYCRGRITDMLTQIGAFETSRENKIKLFRDILADPYFGKLLQNATEKETAPYLLKQEKFARLLGYLNLRGWLIRCKRKLKKIMAR